MLKKQSDKKEEVNKFIYLFFMQGLKSKAFLILAFQCGVAQSITCSTD